MAKVIMKVDTVYNHKPVCVGDTIDVPEDVAERWVGKNIADMKPTTRGPRSLTNATNDWEEREEVMGGDGISSQSERTPSSRSKKPTSTFD